MTAVVNPTKISITDPNISLEGVTAFKVFVGTTTGGPYTVSSATLQVASMTAGANGVESEPLSAVAFSPPLQPFVTYFAVAEAVNAQGVSVNSPEASFQVLAAPSAPTALVFS